MSKAATPDGTVVVAPTIQIGGGTLPAAAQQALVRTVIDTHLHLPGMFEMTFLDNAGTVLPKAGISVGTTVSISSTTISAATPQSLITGEVTALEGICSNLNCYTVVRGYDLCHRLQRVRRTRTFVQQTDSDIATKVAQAAGLSQLNVEASSAVHDFVGQCDQTDWEFLSQRAREIGYETGISRGIFYFRKASSVTTSTGSPIALIFPQNLRRFLPRVTAGNLPQSVEVRVWDPLQAKVIAQDQDVSTGPSASLNGTTPASLAGTFPRGTPPAGTAQPGVPAVGNL